MPFQLLLTASVHPNGMFVKVADSRTRERQYLAALEALLHTPSPLIHAITLIENSGADLEPFHDLVAKENRHGKRVELLSLHLNDFPRELGIGYGEFRCLDAGITQSKLTATGTYLVKLTGRLIVRNLVSILAHLPADFDMAADLLPNRGDRSRGWLESRLMIFSPQFYHEKVAGLYEQVNGSKGITVEHCLYEMVRKSVGAKIVTRLPGEPKWVGFSGSTGARYDRLAMRMRFPVKAALRAVSRLLSYPSLESIQRARPVSPTSGTPGEGRGKGSREAATPFKFTPAAPNPHPNPPPEYRRRA